MSDRLRLNPRDTAGTFWRDALAAGLTGADVLAMFGVATLRDLDVAVERLGGWPQAVLTLKWHIAHAEIRAALGPGVPVAEGETASGLLWNGEG